MELWLDFSVQGASLILVIIFHYKMFSMFFTLGCWKGWIPVSKGRLEFHLQRQLQKTQILDWLKNQRKLKSRGKTAKSKGKLSRRSMRICQRQSWWGMMLNIFYKPYLILGGKQIFPPAPSRRLSVTYRRKMFWWHIFLLFISTYFTHFG